MLAVDWTATLQQCVVIKRIQEPRSAGPLLSSNRSIFSKRSVAFACGYSVVDEQRADFEQGLAATCSGASEGVPYVVEDKVVSIFDAVALASAVLWPRNV